MRRRSFLEDAAITVAGYGTIFGAVAAADVAVGAAFDFTDDFDGEYNVEELSGNMGDMQVAEIYVEGHPSYIDSKNKLLDVELVDWGGSAGDWDIHDDDGIVDAEVWDDDDFIHDAEESYRLHESPEGGGESIQVYDEGNHIKKVLGERPGNEPAEQRVGIRGTVKRGNRGGYTVEIDNAKLV